MNLKKEGTLNSRMNPFGSISEIDFYSTTLPQALESQPFYSINSKRKDDSLASEQIQRKRDTNTLAKQKGMTEECQRMAFLIGLLNHRGVGFNIAKRAKKAEKSLQYIEVIDLFGIVDVSHKQLMDVVLKEETECSIGTTQSYNERYHRKNIFAVTYNYLLQLATNLYDGSVKFETKKTKSSKLTVKMQKFISVSVKDKTFSSEEISSIGNKIYLIISEMMNWPSPNSFSQGNNFVRIEPNYHKFQQEMGIESLSTLQNPTKYWLIDDILEFERQHPEKCICTFQEHSTPSAFKNVKTEWTQDNTEVYSIVPSSINKKSTSTTSLKGRFKTISFPIQKK